VVPILLTEEISTGVFISNNAFLISSFVIGLLLRYNNQKLLLSEMALRAELSEDKRLLELHSDTLKDQVVRTSDALAITEQKYRDLFDHANDGIIVLDRFGNITDVNFRFCELHGFACDALQGTNFRLIEIESAPGEIDGRMERILGGESLVYEAEHYRKDGSRVLLEISSRAIDIGGIPHIQSFHRDITEKVKLKEQMLQSQKMESLGELAGSMAHDFQNVLTAILAHTEVLRRHVKSDDFGQRRITTIEDAAKRAGLMISKLLSFARKESMERAPADLNSVVTDAVELVGRALLEHNIKIRMMLDPEVPFITGDAIHLEQVITNLVMNARDAMPRGGTITIATSRYQAAKDAAHASPFLRPGGYVVLSVRDSGTGIPREIADRIFDPFFTTKPAGKGTGLGLAIVYGVVKSHNGEIRVESREGEGTTFELYFPELEPDMLSPAAKAGAGAAAAGQRVLVIDDDPAVLSSIREALERQGYQVITAETAEAAMKVFPRHAGEIPLVITDIVLPVMNGTELANVFKEIEPGVKVVGMSGFESGAIVSSARHIDCFLKKPFDEASLINCVQRMLLPREKSGSAGA
jgi:PAS domain S-box-containing protein